MNKKEEDEERKEIIASINRRRTERVRKHLPRWYLAYERFRSLIFLLVLVSFNLLLLASLFSVGAVPLSILLFALVVVYLSALMADRMVTYLAFRKVPIEAYYQDENHY